MSSFEEEEMRIREELEKEVERGMEDELKDGIYQLALRLHHLYRQQNEQRMNQQAGNGKKLIASELIRINIRMEGATKIEFTEIKKEVAVADPKKMKPPTIIVASQAAAAAKSSNVCFVRPKKFDWTQTLRSEDGGRTVAPAGKNKKKAFIF